MRRLRLNEQVSPAIMQLVSIGLIPKDIRPKPTGKSAGKQDKKMKLDKDIKQSLKEFKYRIKRTINTLKRKK